MTEMESLKFNWRKITTDEFAIIEQFDSSHQIDIAINIGFAVIPEEHSLTVQAKCIFNQLGKHKLIIAVSGYFGIEPSDWQILIKEKETIKLPHLSAQAFASLVLSTLRGVLHTKTDGLPENSIILPPINIADIVKEPITIGLTK